MLNDFKDLLHSNNELYRYDNTLVCVPPCRFVIVAMVTMKAITQCLPNQ